MKSWSKRFMWGTPTGGGETDKFRTAILARIEKEKSGEFKPVEIVDHALQRITDKSVGLLQADSILAAIAAVYATQTSSPLVSCLSHITLVIALISCLLLIFNLAIFWARDSSVYEDPAKDFAFSMKIYQSRAKRFTTAWVISIGAFVGARSFYCRVVESLN